MLQLLPQGCPSGASGTMPPWNSPGLWRVSPTLVERAPMATALKADTILQLATACHRRGVHECASSAEPQDDDVSLDNASIDMMPRLPHPQQEQSNDSRQLHCCMRNNSGGQ